MKEFIEETKRDLKIESTICIGFNPGFGSGFEKLTESWVHDISFLLEKGFLTVFTQANDYSDLKGETLVLKSLVKPKYIIEGKPNPFRALTHYHEPGKKETSWCCSSSHYYVI